LRRVGTIREIWRYPVKGMAGECVERCHLDAMGLAGDRIWALRDTARAEIQSCKFRPQLLLCDARYKDEPGGSGHVSVRFPDESELDSDDPRIHAQLSALVGHPSTLEPLRPDADVSFFHRHRDGTQRWLDELKATFERTADEPLPDFFDDFPAAAAEYVSLPGSFFLVTPFHLLTTSTLDHLRQLHPTADWDRRRFRPNVVIDTEPGLEGLVEQAWVGGKLQLGAATIDCVSTTPRCGAITRAQRGLDADSSILRTVVREAEQNVGIYGSVTNSGELRVGDAIYLL